MVKHGFQLIYIYCSNRDEKFYEKKREEAFRWLKQAESDLAGAKWLLRSGPPFNALACFNSHEVVEKCMKAMFFYYCGISASSLGSHDVMELADILKEDTEWLPDVTVMKWLRTVSDYYVSPRYPNCQPFNVVPAEAFDLNQAESAVDAASKMLEYVKDCFRNKIF